MTTPRSAPLVGAVLLAAALVGCSSDDDGATAPAAAADASAPAPGSTSSATPSAAPSAANPSAEATVVDVSGTEFAFALSQQEFSPGDYTFVLSDDGQAPHALTITGPGVDATSDRVDPGGTVELSVTLEAGEYELLCPVGNHAAQGMVTTITVG